MGRRTSGSDSGALVVLVAVVAAIAAIPKEIWIGLGVVVLIAAGVYAYRKLKTQPPALPPASDDRTLAELMRTPRHGQPHAQTVQWRDGRSSERPLPRPRHEPSFEAPAANAPSGFKIPTAPMGYGGARWIRPGETVEVAGVTLPGGLFYVGTSLAASHGDTDPSLINPKHAVAGYGDFTTRQMDYWPSYSGITPTARRSYLNWLADGRQHPDADAGFVFLFFYGLERRVLIGVKDDPQASADWDEIAEEIQRLLSIYGSRSGSFRRYASSLLDWMSLSAPPLRMYERPVPAFPKSYELPVYLRLALGQAAVDRAPVPAHLALAWARLNPAISMRTAAQRCADEFDRLFLERYAEFFAAGLVLPRNRTKLKFVYQPASSGLFGHRELSKSFGDIPDVTALTAPLRQLQEVVDSCTEDLDSFSRLVGRNPEARTSLDGLLQLPSTLWPEAARKKLESLISRLQSGRISLGFGELLAELGSSTGTYTRDKIRSLARALEASNIGMEPHVLGGAKAPTREDLVVLFAMPPSEVASTDSTAYQAATLTLQLASAVAQADGDFNANEVEHLRTEVESWSHLTPPHQRRLQAHLHWLTVAPVTLASLKKKLEPLDQKAKETIAAFMATLAQADGTVSPAEVKFLEKVYKALGVDAKRVFSDVHAVSAGGVSLRKLEETGFKLDAKRIAELQIDTEKVSALLSDIFKEEDVSATMPVPSEIETEEIPATTGMFGLDPAHSALARLMLSRPQWTREELEDVASDLELMLDGALERINEASFDAYDLPFAEGEDPVDVNTEVVEKVEA